MSEKNGGCAFPTTHETLHGMVIDGGMTLRDYFAAKALVGLLSCPKVINGADTISASDYTSMAFEMADAMIKARDE